MVQVFIGIGSNLGDKREYIQKALGELKKMKDTVYRTCSSLYDTEPVGVKIQPKFLNMVVEVHTTLDPHDILRALKNIEVSVGRKQHEHWGPREIDLDLLYYGDKIMNDEILHLPHPEIPRRRFVLVPMKEIAENFFDPLQRLTIGELLRYCSDTSTVRKLSVVENTEAAE